MSRTDRDPTLLRLTVLAVALAVGHHVDHAVRGNHVGWPLTAEVNAFTFSLGIYPAIAIGLLLYFSGRVGPGFWAFLSGGGAAFLAFIHFARRRSSRRATSSTSTRRRSSAGSRSAGYWRSWRSCS